MMSMPGPSLGATAIMQTANSTIDISALNTSQINLTIIPTQNISSLGGTGPTNPIKELNNPD